MELVKEHRQEVEKDERRLVRGEKIDVPPRLGITYWIALRYWRFFRTNPELTASRELLNELDNGGPGISDVYGESWGGLL